LFAADGIQFRLDGNVNVTINASGPFTPLYTGLYQYIVIINEGSPLVLSGSGHLGDTAIFNITDTTTSVVFTDSNPVVISASALGADATNQLVVNQFTFQGYFLMTGGDVYQISSFTTWTGTLVAPLVNSAGSLTFIGNG
jgi:hypothetical protein